jgi:hypothetical protein
LLALALRLPGLGRASLWWDECASLEAALAVSFSGAGAIASAVLRGLSGYFLLLAPWVTASTSERVLRLPSVLAGVVLVPVAWWIGHEILGRSLAWRLGLAAGISPFLVWHAREARWYSLTWLLAGLGLIHFVRAIRNPSAGDLLACLAWGLLATVTYPPAIVPVAVEALWLSAGRSRGGGGERHFGKWSWMAMLAGGGIAVLGLTWIWHALVAPMMRGGAGGFGFRNVGGPSLAAVAYTPLAFATGYTIGPGPAEWHARPLVYPGYGESGIMIMAVAAMLILVVAGCRKLRKAGMGTTVGGLATVSALTGMATLAASVWTGHVYAPRHAGLAYLPLLVLAAAGTLRDQRGSRWAGLAGAVLLAAQALSIANLHASARYEREAVRPAAAWVAGCATPGDLVLVFGGIDLPWRHYYEGRAPWLAVYSDDQATWTPEKVRDRVAGVGRIFVVRGLILRIPAEAPILAAVADASRPGEMRRYPGVEITVRQAGP